MVVTANSTQTATSITVTLSDTLDIVVRPAVVPPDVELPPCFLPLSSMLVFNSLIVAKLISARVRKHGGSSTAGGSTAGGSTSGGSTAGGTAMSKVSDSVTVMLVAVCVLFAVTTTPYAAMYNVNSDVSTLKYALMIQGIYINHSANIFIYLIFNKRFRSECKAILCGKSSKVEPGRRNDSIQLEANHTSAEYA